MVMRAVEGDSWFEYPATYNEKNVKAIIHKAFVYVKPTSDNTSNVKLIMNTDP